MSQFTYSINTYFTNGLSLNLLNNTISTTLLSWTGTFISNGKITFTFSSVIIEGNLITILQNHVPNQTPFYLNYQNTGSWTSMNLSSYLLTYNISSIALDTFALLCFNVIPVVTTINQVMTAYVEPPAVTSVQVQMTANQNLLTTSSGDTLFSINPQEIVVSQIGRGHFTTISAAIASVQSGNVVIIHVYPGTYQENNPISLPNGCSIKAVGSAMNTIIIGKNSNVPVFETSISNIIDSLTIIGGSYGVSHNGLSATTFSGIENTIFLNSTVSVAGSPFLLSRVNFIFSNTDNSNFIAITVNGGSLIANDVKINSIPTSLGGGGLLVTNGGLASIDVFSVYYCTNAVSIKNNSSIRSTLVTIQNCTNGCSVLPNDVGYGNLISQYCIGTLTIEGSTAYDLNIEANANLQFLAAQLDDSKIYNPNNIIINSNIQNYRNTVNYQILSGNVFIGTESISTITSIGTNINTNNMLCYLFDGTNYVDESANFRIPADPPVTINNQSLFISHKTSIINGFDIYSNLNTNPTLSYWNGSTWVNLNYSIYDIKNLTFSSQITNSASIYFDNTYLPQQVAVNSVTAYWIRVTLSNCNITNIVLHANCSAFNIIGQNRKYGQTRCNKQIHIPVNIINGAVNFCLSSDFDISSPYTINVYAATSGITLNGQSFSGTSASVTLYAINTTLQTVTLSASNVQCITVLYLSIA